MLPLRANEGPAARSLPLQVQTNATCPELTQAVGMRVETGKQAAFGLGSRMQEEASPEPTRAAAGRALVTLAPAVTPPPSLNYREASFLAHLIATKDQAPQTRERRRADPSEAIAAYRAASALIRG